MTRRGGMGLLAASAALVGCGSASDSASYRFRMTVEVTTPQGVRTGSSVYQVTAFKGISVGDRGGGGTELSGEAVVIDLPDGPIFALLSNGNPAETLAGIATEAFATVENRPISGFDEFFAAVARLGSRWSTLQTDLPRRRDSGILKRTDGDEDNNWPMFLRFRDIGDPKSVERIEPETIGVTRIRLETTRDAVTTGVKKRLPSFKASSGFDAWYAELPMTDPRRVTLDDFTRG